MSPGLEKTLRVCYILLMRVRDLHKVIIFFIVLLSLLFVLFLFYCNLYITFAARHALYDSSVLIPGNKVGLLLGTSKYLKKGVKNPYFRFRLDAAWELYLSRKIFHIIASGDNSEMSYNEPLLMQKGLIRRGVPADNIFLDYAGFRTLDSIVRSSKIFGQNKITIISQKFHNERAIYIARHYGIDAVGYNARDISGINSAKTLFREIFARLKAFIDLHVTDTQPKYLGEQIRIR